MVNRYNFRNKFQALEYNVTFQSNLLSIFVWQSYVLDRMKNRVYSRTSTFAIERDASKLQSIEEKYCC